jgi:electron transport complex protein RnfA
MSYMLAFIFVAMIANNVVLSQFLGICPFLGVTKKMDTAIGMGLAVVFVVTLAAIVTWLVYFYILTPLGVTFLRTIAFILCIAALVQVLEMFMKKSLPSLFQALGIYLPLITVNCVIMGVALLNIDQGYNIVYSIVFAIATGLGFTLAMAIMAGIRERLELANTSEFFKGAPVTLVTAGILALAFMGLRGLVSL